ncbi:MAG TPA: type II toxin-antitoxin system VapC family toxin [Rubrobacter sp.]|nr:type II toxin-antitoxin system VapC family toxin [Rubrobacter sp.]
MSREVSWWLDANVLLRFLTGSPPELAGRAARLLEEAQRGEVSLRVHSVVVAETVWVLESFYGYSKEEISDVLIALVEQPALRVEGAKTVVRALATMAEGNMDFADALLAETARSRGEGVVSFDRDFRKLDVEWREPN